MPAARIQVLLVEDNPDDAQLLLRELRKDGFEPQARRVETEADYLAALLDPPEFILSDFELPQFNGLRALDLLMERGLEIPFVIVSGTIGEEVAVEAIKRGAADYLLKDRLARLGSVVRQALDKARLRRGEREAAKAFRESEERFRQVVENIHEVFWMMDRSTGELLYLSPGYERIWGLPRSALASGPVPWRDSIHTADRDRVLKAAVEKQALGGYNETYRIVLPDGTERWIRDRAFPVNDPQGGPGRVVGVAEDITEHRKLEEQLLRAQRMEAIGTLASGLAHDLNNILAPMLLAPGLLKDELSDPHHRKIMELVEISANRGAGIVRQLLAFSRGLGGTRVPIQPNPILREIAQIAKETFPRNIEISWSCSKETWKIVADAIQIHQVLMNLSVNSRDAMPGGGKLQIAAANVELGDADLAIHPKAHAGPYVRITVSDTGSGIPKEHLPRVFDPFFTTKEVGKGTGLGLSTVHGIVANHDGFVVLDSEVGRGTTFSIYLPATPADHTSEPEGQPAEPPKGHAEMILIVDDEAPIRAAARALLQKHGYRTVEASQGEEGVAQFMRHRREIRLVLTDIMMPTMGGLALIRILRALEPKLPIVAFSGLDPAERGEDFARLGVETILLKPVDAGALLEAVHRQLEQPRA